MKKVINMPTKFRPISVEGDKFFYSLSFDIDDFIGDGIWWLQIYDENRNLIYDKPFASSMENIDIRKIRKNNKERIFNLTL